jgi:hypothetical protein
MPFSKPLPEWNKTASKPAQSKLDNGWQAEEKPPASVFNWFFNTTYQALQELQQNAVHEEQIGVDIEKKFHVGTSAPTDTTKLWIDTSGTPYKLKYHNGSSWVIIGQAFSDIPNKPTTLAGYGITDAETPAGAQAKANQAEANAKAASVSKTGDIMTGDLAINGLKTKNLNGSTGGSVKWYKVARIQNENPIAGGEYSTFTGILFVQRDYGNTANNTIGQVNFSFGARNGAIKPVIFATGDGAALTNNNGYKFRVYKDASGWHYLYFMKPYYSNFATFLYRADGCTEYWVEEDPSTVSGLTLVWDSDNGATQDIYVGKNKVWHTGNDGAGSGLDADTVDGKQASDFVWKTEKGAPNGVATLDENGKVPASQLNISTTANAITITDSGGYYTSGNVEGALQEIGQVLNAMRGDLITSVNNVLNM